MLLFPKPGKKKRVNHRKEPQHLSFIAQLPCVITKIQADIHVHHLLRGVSRGMGMKAPDKDTLPLHHTMHEGLHRCGDERWFLSLYGINNPKQVAKILYQFSKKNDLHGATQFIMRGCK